MKFRGGVQSDAVGGLGMVYNSHKVATFEVELSTSGAATTVSDAFPAFSRMVACGAQVTTAIAGADATAFTCSLNGKDIITGADLTAFPATGGGYAWNLGTTAASVQTTGTAGDLVITLTGGSDQTPTAGAVTVQFVYEEFKKA